MKYINLIIVVFVLTLSSCNSECTKLCSQLNELQDKVDKISNSGIMFESDAVGIINAKNKVIDEARGIKSKMKDLNCSCVIKGSEIEYSPEL